MRGSGGAARPHHTAAQRRLLAARHAAWTEGMHHDPIKQSLPECPLLASQAVGLVCVTYFVSFNSFNTCSDVTLNTL